jgi:hypothetical protein
VLAGIQMLCIFRCFGWLVWCLVFTWCLHSVVYMPRRTRSIMVHLFEEVEVESKCGSLFRGLASVV